jgi:hypothetical protein
MSSYELLTASNVILDSLSDGCTCATRTGGLSSGAELRHVSRVGSRLTNDLTFIEVPF